MVRGEKVGKWQAAGVMLDKGQLYEAWTVCLEAGDFC